MSFEYKTIANVKEVTILRNIKTGQHVIAVNSGLQVSYCVFHSYENSFSNNLKYGTKKTSETRVHVSNIVSPLINIWKIHYPQYTQWKIYSHRKFWVRNLFFTENKYMYKPMTSRATQISNLITKMCEVWYHLCYEGI